MERSEVTFGTTRIAYEVRRSARRKTVALAVEPTGDVTLMAPEATPIERLDRLVHDKARWILERLRRRRDLEKPLSPRELVSGETFLYLGRQYRLRVIPEATVVAPLAMRGGLLHVPVPRGLPEGSRSAYVRAALVDWYRRRAKPKLEERVAEWAEKAGAGEPKVVIRDQEKRWASCTSSGVLRFNWRIIQASPRLVDYVVAHEVTHLAHAEHGPAFWSALGRLMPDYETRRAALRALGPRLEW